jgi:hypothetical protein
LKFAHSSLTLFLALLIASATAGSCRSRPTAVVCSTGDLTELLDVESTRLVQTTESTWLRNGLACKTGEYVVVTPRDGGSGQIWLVRNRRPAFIIDNGATTLFAADGKRVVFQSTNGRAPGRNFISYSAYDSSQNAWIENVDSGPDGSVDFRTTEVSGRPVKTEFSVGDRWLELVKRDGEDGTILDGQFMSVAEARAKLGEKAVKPQLK